MVTKFELNGKKVTAKEFDYNLMCDMEEMGFDIDDFGTKPMSALRGYVALCKGCSLEKAGDELTDFVANGGDMEDLTKVMLDKLENARFFRGQQEATEKKTTKD